jgi:hypothetical protein
VTSGQTGASACAPEAGTARTTVADVLGAVGISLIDFQNGFSLNFHTKVYLKVLSKVED